ncbi:MAG: hypothetical protein IKS83_03370 [Victivallales bacterium]|nr:hypothetical protein [Victivallales bacterium]
MAIGRPGEFHADFERIFPLPACGEARFPLPACGEARFPLPARGEAQNYRRGAERASLALGIRHVERRY